MNKKDNKKGKRKSRIDIRIGIGDVIKLIVIAILLMFSLWIMLKVSGK